MDNRQSYGFPFRRLSAFASGSATISVAAVTGRTHYITDLSASSDSATTNVVLSSGSEILWRARIGSVALEKQWRQPISINAGSAFVVSTDTTPSGTANIAISGYYLE